MARPAGPRVPRLIPRLFAPPVRSAFDEIGSSRGRVGGPFAVLLHVPELARRIAAVGEFVRFESKLPPDVRETAILVTAKERGCAYEWNYHLSLAASAGVDRKTISLLDARNYAALGDSIRLVAQFARELCESNVVSEQVHGAISSSLGLEAAIELSALIGYYSMIACVINAAGVVDDSLDLGWPSA